MQDNSYAYLINLIESESIEAIYRRKFFNINISAIKTINNATNLFLTSIVLL